MRRYVSSQAQYETLVGQKYVFCIMDCQSIFQKGVLNKINQTSSFHIWPLFW